MSLSVISVDKVRRFYHFSQTKYIQCVAVLLLALRHRESCFHLILFIQIHNTHFSICLGMAFE